jgi:Uma2 family endonuclease
MPYNNAQHDEVRTYAMAVQTRLLTVDEYVAFGDKPVEVIDGEVVEMSPSTKRQPKVLRRLNRPLDAYTLEKGLGEVFTESSFVLDGEPRRGWVKNARTPDLAFIAKSRYEAHEAEHPSDEEPWWIAPDLVAEIISPTDEAQDVMRKLRDYLTFGVLIVWLIYPKTKSVVVYTQDNHLGTTLTEGDLLTAEPLIPGWSMPVAALFAE